MRKTVPGGTCPTVGLTGLSAAGGFGRLSRLYGLTCDNILEVKLVTAGGGILTANQSENADLLWACKGGGGGNFGAVVELTARLHPVDMLFTEVAYTGISEHGVLPRPAFYAKSDLIRQTWPSQAFEALVEAIERRQADPMLTPHNFQAGVNIGKVAFESAGGAITRVPLTTAAFAHRDIRYVVQYQSRWRPGSSEAVANANIEWTHAMYDAVRPWLSGSAYQGYADPYLSGWQQQYYGASLERLREIKRKYDPENVFRYAQSIPPA
jgi:FAD/FMN-containing dehydrogenase